VLESAAQRRILELHNQMALSPQAFCYRWGIDAATLAQLCCVSQSTTYHWLAGQASRRVAGASYQRILAVADFLLTHAEQMQPLLDTWHRQQQP
jgi:hypothetical protein